MAGCGEMLNLLQVTSGGGCGEFGRLHRADLDLGSVFPYCNRSRRDEKRRFIEIDSEGGGWSFQKKRYQPYGGGLGLEAPVLLGFRYYKGR